MDARADRYVRGRVRSTAELHAYLARREWPAADIASAIRAYQRRGWLNDGACARLWAEQWARQGYAWAAIRLRLLAKGLPPAVVDRAGHQQALVRTDLLRARALVTHALRGGRAAVARRLSRRLAARGFDEETIRQVLPVVDDTTSP